jgi:hypothetical protein
MNQHVEPEDNPQNTASPAIFGMLATTALMAGSIILAVIVVKGVVWLLGL